MLATVRLLAKIRPHDFRIAHHVLGRTVGDLAPRHQHGQALGEFHHRPHDVLDHDHGHTLRVQPDQQRDDLVDLGKRQAGEGPRQLEAARQAAPRALVGRQAVQRLLGEAHAAAFVAQGAADAVHQGRLARAVRPDQAEPLALLYLEVDRLQGDEAAEALAETGDLQQRRHRFLWNRPTMPWGAAITKATISTPATSTLTADEIDTRRYSCKPPTSTAPTTGPSQLPVPPISGMAMAFTA